ncbi:MAG: insulinase family protein [Myxococcales bacterium]|nr:insulinase family protein [Myxococcales bacterium]
MNTPTYDRVGDCELVFEEQHDTQLVWIDIAMRGGAARDPAGSDGLHRHAALLARRGAGSRDRQALDAAIDQLGASVDIGVGRDMTSISAVVLARQMEPLADILADFIAQPLFAQDEHGRLLRETPQVLGEVRDDDASLSSRWFDALVAPGHPYARTSLGTEASLQTFTAEAARELWRAECVRGNVVIGISGAPSASQAVALAQRLTAAMPAGPAPASPALPYLAPTSPRVVLVNKPQRTQAQLRIGHMMPRWGDEAHGDSPALAVIEAAFGGMFSSRLMQEIRVKRGWSYGAGCSIRRSAGPHWFEIGMACDIEMAVQATTLVQEMFAQLRAEGLTASELAFTKDYLDGSIPFHFATARQRVQLGVRDLMFGLPRGFGYQLREQIRAVTADDIARALTWFYPAAALTLMVASAPTVAADLAAQTQTPPEVVEFDAY